MRWPFGPPHLTLKPSKKKLNQKKQIQKITHNKTKETQNNRNNNQNIETWFMKQQQEEVKKMGNKKNQQKKGPKQERKG